MLIQLLTMQKDIQRMLRTIGDEQCQMMQDIHDNRRDVVVTEAPVSSMAVSISHNNFNNIMQSTYSLSGWIRIAAVAATATANRFNNKWKW